MIATLSWLGKLSSSIRVFLEVTTDTPYRADFNKMSLPKTPRAIPALEHEHSPQKEKVL